jgi:hypothetical protein
MMRLPLPDPTLLLSVFTPERARRIGGKRVSIVQQRARLDAGRTADSLEARSLLGRLLVETSTTRRKFVSIEVSEEVS